MAENTNSIGIEATCVIYPYEYIFDVDMNGGELFREKRVEEDKRSFCRSLFRGYHSELKNVNNQAIFPWLTHSSLAGGNSQRKGHLLLG